MGDLRTAFHLPFAQIDEPPPGVRFAVGVVLGGVAAVRAVRFVRTLLFGVEPHDPWMFGAGAAMLIAVACLAAWLPARRAARIGPARVLHAG